MDYETYTCPSCGSQILSPDYCPNCHYRPEGRRQRISSSTDFLGHLSYDEVKLKTETQPGAFSNEVLRITKETVSQPPAREPKSAPQRAQPGLTVSTAMLAWLFSIAAIIVFPLIFMVGATLLFGIKVAPTPEGDPEGIGRAAFIVTLATIPAHLATLLFAWVVVTQFKQRPFWRALGWFWHPRFRLPQAVLTAIFMIFPISWIVSKLVPNPETPLDKIIQQSSFATIITIAVLAAFSAPFVEEVIYRGILYPAFELKLGRIGGIIIVTILFAGVHIIQYWGGWATITVITLLSFTLTTVRAYTGSILPCVIIHFVFNLIQSVFIIARKLS